MRRLLRRQSRDRGAVSVEFVFIVPILLLLIFGIIQFAYYFFQVQQGALAAREGARQAAVGEVQNIDTLVDNWISLPPGDVTGTACYDDLDSSGDLSLADNLQVTVQFTATNFGFPFVPFPSGGQVNEVADTRVEDTTPYVVTPLTACS